MMTGISILPQLASVQGCDNVLACVQLILCVCVQYSSSSIWDKLEGKLNSGPSFKMADRTGASSDRVTARPPFLKGTLRWMFFFLIKSPDWKTEESAWHCFVFSTEWLQSSTVRVWINFLNSKIFFLDSNNSYQELQTDWKVYVLKTYIQNYQRKQENTLTTKETFIWAAVMAHEPEVSPALGLSPSVGWGQLAEMVWWWYQPRVL